MHMDPTRDRPSSRSVAGSADSTSDSPVQAGDTSPSASPIPTDAMSYEPDSPESPSGTTSETWAFKTHHTQANGAGKAFKEYTPSLQADSPALAILTSSPAEPPARTSASPDGGPDSTATAPDSSSSTPESLTLFDLAGSFGRTFPVRSL